MGTATILAAAIAALASVASAFIAARAAFGQREADRREIGRAHLAQSTEQVRIAMLDAMEITLMALDGAEMNGNVDEALQKVRNARDEYTLACAEAAVS